MKLDTNHLTYPSDKMFEDMMRAEELAKKQFAAIDMKRMMKQSQSAFETISKMMANKPSWIKTIEDTQEQSSQLYLQMEAVRLAATKFTLEPFSNFQKIVNQAEKIYKQTTFVWSSQLNTFQNTVWDSFATLPKNTDFQKLFGRYQNYADLFEHVDFCKLQVAADGAVTYDGAIVDLSEADSIVEDLIRTPGEQLDIHNVLDLLVEKLQTVKTPVKAFLTKFIYDLILAILVTCTVLRIPAINAQPEKVSQEEFRSLKKEFEAAALLDATIGTHFVKRTHLRIFIDPNKQSERIDVIFSGKCVTIVRRKSTWALIEYNDEVTGETRYGWVFGRYLEKIRK